MSLYSKAHLDVCRPNLNSKHGLRQRVQRTLGVRLLAPPPQGGVSKDKTRLAKSEFLIDFEAGTAMCPNGIVTAEVKMSHPKVGPHQRFSWPKAACSACPLRDRCLGKVGSRKSLVLHPQEQELRRHRADWAKPEVQRVQNFPDQGLKCG